jgi:branched-chain amino acid transport system substrate-binding protein
VTERAPYIVRTSFTLAQSAVIIGDWAVKNGIKRVATLTSNYAPENDALQFFKARTSSPPAVKSSRRSRCR